MKRSVHSQGRRRAAQAITAVAVATGALFALGVGSAAAQTPVSINVVDVAGNLAPSRISPTRIRSSSRR
jgi:hypothetical protein